MADELQDVKKENEHLKERIKWFEEQLGQMEELVKQYNELVRHEFDSLENVVNKMGTSEIIDPVTRVYSREHVLAYLNFIYPKIVESNLKCSLIFFDVDNFREKTKTLGKNDVDTLIREIGKFLKETVRVPLDIVARFGFDEFLILITETQKKDTISIAQRIKNSFSAKSFKVADVSIQLTATLSVVTFPDDSKELSKLLEIGEDLVEAGKKKGKNMVIFAE
jgi:diguanylate cyclase (GGDEF)-like protein|uniref:GGDEF domain-containing protein n=1 Tax=Mesoaciditoga lauensis TaxID=1495039 RepID=A0A7V3VSV8_9BACT